MIDKKTIIAVATICIAMLCVTLAAWLLWSIHAPKEHDSIERAPDGKEYYDTSQGGTYYIPEFYDEQYGHAADNAGKSFESAKPEYYVDVDLSGVTFPIALDAVFYFPAFLMYDLVSYVDVPEEEMRKWLPDNRVEEILELEREGLIINDQHFPFEKPAPPIYYEVDVLMVDQDVYRVAYSTSVGRYVTRFVMENGKIAREIEGGW